MAGDGGTERLHSGPNGGRPVGRQQRLVAASGIHAEDGVDVLGTRGGGEQQGHAVRREGLVTGQQNEPVRRRTREAGQAGCEGCQRPTSGGLLPSPRHGTLKWTLRTDDDNGDDGVQTTHEVIEHRSSGAEVQRRLVAATHAA